MVRQSSVYARVGLAFGPCSVTDWCPPPRNFLVVRIGIGFRYPRGGSSVSTPQGMDTRVQFRSSAQLPLDDVSRCSAMISGGSDSSLGQHLRAVTTKTGAVLLMSSLSRALDGACQSISERNDNCCDNLRRLACFPSKPTHVALVSANTLSKTEGCRNKTAPMPSRDERVHRMC